MMTVGQHDDAWLDVMQNRIPHIDKALTRICNQLIASNMLNIMVKEYEAGLITEEEYKNNFKELEKLLKM